MGLQEEGTSLGRWRQHKEEEGRGRGGGGSYSVISLSLPFCSASPHLPPPPEKKKPPKRASKRGSEHAITPLAASKDEEEEEEEAAFFPPLLQAGKAVGVGREFINFESVICDQSRRKGKGVVAWRVVAVAVVALAKINVFALIVVLPPPLLSLLGDFTGCSLLPPTPPHPEDPTPADTPSH